MSGRNGGQWGAFAFLAILVGLAMLFLIAETFKTP